MAKFSTYVAKLSDAEYREFVEDRFDVLGAAVERLSTLVESEIADLQDPTQTDAFKRRRCRLDELRKIQGWMQSRFTGD